MDGISTLHAFAKEGNAKAIEKAAKAQPMLLDARDTDGMAPLHYAAWYVAGSPRCRPKR
jgi:hypothetical protein